MPRLPRLPLSLRLALAFTLAFIASGCPSAPACSDPSCLPPWDGGADGSSRDSGRMDSSMLDAAVPDASRPDAGCVCGAGLTCDSGGACVPATCPASCGDSCPQGCFDAGECPAGSDAPRVVANVHTAGLSWMPGPAADAPIFYRRTGDALWMRAHRASALPDGRAASSLFDLAPSTDYEALIKGAANTLCALFRTLPDVPAHTTTGELYVDAAASSGGDGSMGAPFATIQQGVDAASAGTDVHIAAGVYHEEVSIGGTFALGSYLRLLGEPGAILDGADPAAVHPAFRMDGANLYSAAYAGDPRYVTRDGARLYHFESLADVQAGTGHRGVSIREGYFADGSRIYLRSLDDPASHDFAIPDLNTAVALDGADGVWIEGLEIRHYGSENYGKGVDIRASDHVVVRGCHIHDVPSPVWVRRGSRYARVERNTIHQSFSEPWPWEAMKATDHENSAVTVAGGEQTIVAHNDIYAIFNGVYAGSFSDDRDASIADDVDVYDNRLRNIPDDGLEPEGACVNVRYWANVIDGVHNGVSLAPITFGPTWVMRNRFTDYDQSGFKVSNDSSGAVFLYHNTCYTDRADQNGMNVSGPFTNMVFRNNIVRGTKYALEMSRAASPNDLDYDNWFTTRGAPVIKWDNTRYDDVPAWCAATSLECHAQSAAPMLVNPASHAFAPQASSPNVDAAERILGVNDHYLGDAPDIGYVEAGASELAPLDAAPFTPPAP